MDNVIFKIQLFKTQDRQHVLIEIERKKGDTVQYHYLARAIITILKRMEHDSNEGDVTPICSSARSLNESEDEVNKLHVCNNDGTTCSSTMPINEDSDKIKFQNTMERVSTLLQKDRLDAMLLGMESLLYLTNGKSSKATITYLSVKSILQDGIWRIVRDFIFDLIQDNGCCESFPLEEDRKTLEVGHKHLMKQQALEILANSLAFMTKHHSSEMQMILKTSFNEWKELLLSLSLHTNPSNSNEMQKCFQTARCVYYLVSFSVDMRDAALSSNVCEKVFDYQHHINHQFLNPLFSEMMESIAEVYSDCK